MIRLLSIRRVAELCDVSPKTIRRWLAAGQFPQPVELPNSDLRWLLPVVEGWILTRPAGGKAAAKGEVK
ncbi:hypothetical protein BH11PLA2_BH11PLA2_18140 [soil metagenome]